MSAARRRKRAYRRREMERGAMMFAAQNGQGAAPKLDKKQATTEICVSGLSVTDGIVENEYLSDLDSVEKRFAAYERIRKGDGAGAVIYNLVSMPIRRASYTIESRDPGQTEMCEVLQQNLIEVGGMTHTWDEYVRHAVLAVMQGFSVHEKVWEERNGLLAIRKLPGRHPRTHSRWLFDDTGGLAGWEQTGTRVSTSGTDDVTVQIPIEKLIVLTYGGEYGDPEGWGMLRNVYKHWYHYDTLCKIAAVKAEREACGVPIIQPREGTTSLSDEDKDAFLAILQRIRALETGAMVITNPNVELRAFELGAGDTPWMDLILHHRNEILRAALVHFVMLGTDANGSGKALHVDASTLFLSAMEAVADWFCACNSAYLIRQYVDYNWGPQQVYPEMKHGGITEKDRTVLAEVVRDIWFNPQMDPERYQELDEYLRNELGLPARPGGYVEQKQPNEDQEVEEPDEDEEPEPPAEDPDDDEEDEDEDVPAEASADVTRGALEFVASPEETQATGSLLHLAQRAVTVYMARLEPMAREGRYQDMLGLGLPYRGQIEAAVKDWLTTAAKKGVELIREQTGRDVTLGQRESRWIATKAKLLARRLEANVQWVVCNGLCDDLQKGQPVNRAIGNAQARMMDQVTEALSGVMPTYGAHLVDALQTGESL